MSDPTRYPLTDPKLAVFVGQGPNRTAWEHGLDFGEQASGLDRATTDGAAAAERWAERYCARVACTGAVGSKIGALLGISGSEFFHSRYARVNLNARFNGKAGKGDVFDRKEAALQSVGWLGGKWTHYVLLGAEVAGAFGYKNPEWLSAVGRYVRASAGGEVYKNFFFLPHPSGINSWWNDDFNRFRARKRLREFLNIQQ